MTQKHRYVWEGPLWPELRWDGAALLSLLGECRFHQGKLLAQVGELGLEIQKQAQSEVLVEETLKRHLQ